jgi:hypothetical protein
LLLGAVVAWVGRNPLAWVFAVVWPVAMFFSVVMTGNHFIIDAIAGGIVSFAGLGVALAIERWGPGVWDGLRRRLTPGPPIAAESE